MSFCIGIGCVVSVKKLPLVCKLHCQVSLSPTCYEDPHMMYTRPFKDFDLSIDPNKSRCLPISILSLTHLPRWQEDFNKYQITVCLLQLTSGILVSSKKMFIELIPGLQIQVNDVHSTSYQPAQGLSCQIFTILDLQFVQVFKGLRHHALRVYLHFRVDSNDLLELMDFSSLAVYALKHFNSLLQ